MFLKPNYQDIKTIGYYLGKIIFGLGLLETIPLIFGIFVGEFNPALDFVIASLVAIIISLFLMHLCKTDQDLNWVQGMVVASFSWIVAMFLSAIPLYLSGHYKSYLDCAFDMMSSFTTSGLTLVQDLDHLSMTTNLWRHFAMFIGGMGIVVMALTFLVKGSAGAFKIYVAEAREEKLLPNIIETSRFIVFINMVYLVLGSLVLWVVGMHQGMPSFSAFFNGLLIFMAAFSTGGFTPHSQSVLYYHSLSYEVITIVILVIGSLNFNLHYAVWRLRRKEIITNIETRTFFITLLFTFFIVAAGLSKLGVYSGAMGLFRKGFYILISGHTTTGFGTIYTRQFINEWGNAALAGLIIAMGLGASACSTGGGIKMLRVGIIFQALKEDMKRMIVPEKAIIFQKFHHVKNILLEDKQVRAVFLVTISYIALYALGAVVGAFCGYPFLEALFESTSAAANVGLSCGITDTAMPVALKITYIIQMWAGRLEFMSIFAIAGFLVAWVKGKR
ncbi:MAG: potassium transporter TrkG [Candidatus Omnitrophota bacterium]